MASTVVSSKASVSVTLTVHTSLLILLLLLVLAKSGHASGNNLYNENVPDSRVSLVSVEFANTVTLFKSYVVAFTFHATLLNSFTPMSPKNWLGSSISQVALGSRVALEFSLVPTKLVIVLLTTKPLNWNISEGVVMVRRSMVALQPVWSKLIVKFESDAFSL